MTQLSPDDINYLEALHASNVAPTPEQGNTDRALARGANFYNNATGNIYQMFQNVGDVLTDKPQKLHDAEARETQDLFENRGFYKNLPTTPAGAGNTLGKVIDVGANIVDQLPAYAIPAGAFGKTASVLGAGERLASVAGNVGAGLVGGSGEGAKESLTQGAEFGAMDAAGLLFPKSRLLRTAAQSAAGAGIGVAGQAMRGNDPWSESSLTQAGVMAALPIVHGAPRIMRGMFQRETPSTPNAPASTATPTEGTPLSPEEKAGWKLRDRTPTDDGRFKHTWDLPDSTTAETVDREPRGTLAGEAAPAQDEPATFSTPPGEPPAAAPLPPRPLLTPRPPRPAPGYQEPVAPTAPVAEGLPAQSAISENAPKQILRRQQPAGLSVFDPTLIGTGGEASALPDISQEPSVFRNAVRPKTPELAVPESAPTSNEGGSLREAVNNRSVVEYNGEQGKLHAEEDGVYFRKLRSGEKQRVYGLQPDDPVSAVPGLNVVKPGTTKNKRMLRPLNSGESGAASKPLMHNLLATGAGALTGYATGTDDEDRIKRALLFGAGASGLHLLGRKLLSPLFGERGERAAAGQLGAKDGVGKTWAGWARRFGEKYFKAGQSGTVDTLMEQSRNAGASIMQGVSDHAKQVIPIARKLTPSQWDDYATFMASGRTAGEKARLALTVPPEIVDFAVKTSEAEQKLQQIHADAQPAGSPRKVMLERSIKANDYQTKPYMAFEDPKAWQARGVDPALEKQILAENRADPRFSGQTEQERVSDWNEYKKDIQQFGGDVGKYGAGGQRISESLFTPRKVLRPSMEKFLGLIENPMQRQILTNAKLAKGAAVAKAIKEFMDPATVDENGNRPVMGHKEYEAALTAATAAGDTKKADFLRSNYDQMPDTMKGLGLLAGEFPPETVMAQRQVLDALHVGDGHKVFSNDDGLLAMLNRIPKAAHTVWNPGTHVHNMAQIPLMGALAGLNPVELVTHNARMFNNPDLLRKAQEDGIMSAHAGVAEYKRGDDLQHILNPTFWQKAGKLTNDQLDKVKRLYGVPDQIVRLAKYSKELDRGLANGLTEKQARTYATEITNRTTHNYSNVPQAVKVMRNIPLVNSFVTFTTEMARVMKNRAYDVLEDPMAKKYGKWASQKLSGTAALVSTLGAGAAITAAASYLTSDEDRKKYAELLPFLPAYMRGKSQPLLSRKDGVDSTYNLNPLLPAEDFKTMARNIAAGDWDALARNNPIAGVDRSPVWNVVAEQWGGKDAMGRPTKGILSNLAQNALPGWFPGNYGAEKLKQGFTRNDQGTLGVTDSTGREETPGTAIASLFGVNVTKVNEAALFRRAKQDQEDAITAAKSDLKRVLRSNTNDAEKDKAKAAFDRRVDKILADAPR